MERRYLVAALAIIATFAGTSRGFHSLQRMALAQGQRAAAPSVVRCWTHSAAQAVARVRAHFQHDYSPEEAQLVAEMDVPNMQTTIAEQMSRQDADIARCARERALEQAEQARRDAVGMQQELSRTYRDPISVHVNLPADFEKQTAAAVITAKLAASQVKLLATEKLADIQIPSIDVSTDTSTFMVPNVHCKVKVSRQSLRDTMRGFQYGFTSK